MAEISGPDSKSALTLAYRRGHMMNKTLADYYASTEVLRDNIDLFYKGRIEAYRPAAVELRKLLCDKNDGVSISLLPRVFPDLKLLQLKSAARFQREPNLAETFSHYTPNRLAYPVGELPMFGLQFDEQLVKLTIPEWIEQPFFSRIITVEKVIKSVADLEGAHSDPQYRSALRIMRKHTYNDVDSHRIIMVAIGEYLLRTIEHEKPEVNPELLCD